MSRKSPPKTFEQAMTRLEEITAKMQNSILPLEEALSAYQEGTELLAFCRQKLSAVEQQLSVLDNGEIKELKLDE